MKFTQFTAARADTGAPLPGATATVCLSGTTTPVVLRDASMQVIGTQVTADNNGLLQFFVPDGTYDIRVVSADGAYSVPVISNFQIFDLAGIVGTITSGRLSYATWAELAAITPGTTPAATAGLTADIPTTDTGTHTDPVVGGTVSNSGVYRYKTGSPSGWQRIYDSVTAQVAAAVASATASAAAAANSAAGLTVNPIQQGIFPAVAGTGGLTNGLTIFSQTPISVSGYLRRISVYASAAAASGAKALILALNVDGTVRKVSELDIVLTVGLNTISWRTPVAAGQFVGVYSPGGLGYVMPIVGVGAYYTTGVPGTATSGSTAKTVRNDLSVELGWEVDTALSDRLNTVEGSVAAELSVGTWAPPGTITTTGTSYQNQAFYAYPSGIKSYGQFINSVTYPVGAPGVGRIVVCKVETNGNLTFFSSTNVSFTATGVQTASPAQPVWVPAGYIAGLVSDTALTGYYDTTVPGGEDIWTVSSIPTTNTAKTITQGPWVKFSFATMADTKGRARSAFDTANSVLAALGTQLQLGYSNIVNTGSVTPAGYTAISVTPAPANGVVSRMQIGASATGTANLVVMNISGGGVVSNLASYPVSVINGVVSPSMNVPVQAGQYVGISGGAYMFQNGAGAGQSFYVKATAVANGDTLTISAQHRYEVNWTISTGLYASVAGGSIAGTGLDLLATADSSGVVDVTSLFSSARSAHPFPYVRPGTFAVTSVAAAGGGFWGPGNVLRNARKFFMPPSPQTTNLYTRLRAALLEHIAAGDVLTLIADSIGHFAYAPTGPTHWFNLMCYFLNQDVALDEPIMTALRPSSTYVPDFYGVTGTGGTTGTRGPLAESLILAAGESRTFTGAYERVGVFYTQQASQGTLSFQFNGGAAFLTVNASGSLELDKLGIADTGQASSGTYTITNTGSNPVEITGLIRLGVRAATGVNDPRRMLMNRSAHGSYTFGNFVGAPLTSIVKQGQAFGGRVLPIVALGINDSFGSVAALLSNATSVLDGLVAAGCDRIFVVVPSRPSSAWNVTYGTNSYDLAIGALRRLYRQRGVTIIVIPLDGIDWNAEGLNSDGLHPGGLAGQYKYGQVVIEGIAATAGVG